MSATTLECANPVSADESSAQQMGTKPAKVGHLAATLLKYVPTKKTGAPAGFEPGPIAYETERLTLKLNG